MKQACAKRGRVHFHEGLEAAGATAGWCFEDTTVSGAARTARDHGLYISRNDPNMPQSEFLQNSSSVAAARLGGRRLKDRVAWIPVVMVTLQQNRIEMFTALLMYLEETLLPTALPGHTCSVATD